MDKAKAVIENLLVPTVRQLVNLRSIRNGAYCLDRSLLNEMLTDYRKQLAMLLLLEAQMLQPHNLQVLYDEEEHLKQYLKELISVTQEILNISLQLVDVEFHRFINKSI